MTPTVKPALSLLLVTVVLALSGCRKTADEAPPATAAESTQSAADAPAADGPKLPRIDWWAPIAPIAARSYEGACKAMPDMKATGPIVVGTDGSVKHDTYSGTLGQSDVTLMRIVRNGVSTASLIAGNKDDVLTIMDGGGDQPDNVQLSIGDKGVSCSEARDVLPLQGKTLYALYAKTITVPARKISCLKISQMSTTSLDFALQDDQLKLGDQVFDLRKASTEQMIFKPSAGTTAGYSVMDGDKRRATVMYDEFGRLSDVQVMIDGGDSYGCSNLNQPPA